MFGDIGHGLALLLFSIYICYDADKIKEDKKSILKVAVKARYLLLLMGIFAFYCGWMYNDFLSVPLPIFGTCYENKNGTVQYAIKKYPSCVYPFGVDPKWKVAKNELSFVNSLKMKMSVIFGVSHMIFGILLRGMNDLYFGNIIGFIFEFIPQIIFMSILFGYMDAMIFMKWAQDWSSNTSMSPSLISQMMNIFLKFGSVADKPLWGGRDGTKYTQEQYQFAVLITCALLIPFMLIPKPIIMYFKNKKSNDHNERNLDEQRMVK
jgi:V-type H+-transporting ATPase subunit a